ncbi:MAG TPA: YraN family protein [Candidatus Fimivicinus intestinavium]|nr:YraN family protein [Candidatus Fimivicinus intestinavium]
MDSKQYGPAGERACARRLREKGYRILCANYRTRFGELDMIAQQGPYIVFVEVKTRGPHAIAAPMEAVTPAKQRRLMRTAELYLAAHPSALQPRFDVMEVEMDGEGHVTALRHLENAFDAQEEGDF